jgi:hypothetical protein
VLASIFRHIVHKRREVFLKFFGLGQKPDFEDDDGWGQPSSVLTSQRTTTQPVGTWELDARPELWRKFAIIEVALVGLDLIA